MELVTQLTDSFGYDLKTDYGNIRINKHDLGDTYYTFDKEFDNWVQNQMQLRGYQDYYTDGLTDRISGAANWQAAGRAIVTYLPFPPLFTGSACIRRL